ncbi:hypothetical protein PROFUN_04007 [Planoprotostelium fungivorum]|uniref:Non-specific serine/threonine protein kinase n=1 Tax=Planoprotostelium fungivorum TaxID=1890364 RepID=A0A2P6NW43_9EUKA|nr:hypothetical protein PROFUN_04007 [Planoprotostelium fungivorum]
MKANGAPVGGKRSSRGAGRGRGGTYQRIGTQQDLGNDANQTRGDKKQQYTTIQNLIRTVSNSQEYNSIRLKSLGQLKDMLSQSEGEENMKKFLDKSFNAIELGKERATSVRTDFMNFILDLSLGFPQHIDVVLSFFFKKLNVHCDRETLTIHLNLFNQYINRLDPSVLMPYGQMITNRLQGLLEDSQHADVIKLLLQSVIVLSERLPPVFKLSFRDVLDILVGLKLDPSSSDQTSTLISDSFSRFGLYWMEDASFALELLDKFMIDMKKIVGTPSEDQNDALKLFRFIDCFTAIMRVISPYFIQESGKMVPKLLNCIRTITDKYVDRRCLLEVNKCLVFLSEVIEPTEFSVYYSSILYIMSRQVKVNSHYDVIENVLQSNMKILRRLGTSLHLMGVSKLTGSVLSDLRLFAHSNIIRLSADNFVQLLDEAQMGSGTVQFVMKMLLEECNLLINALNAYYSMDSTHRDLHSFRKSIPSKLWNIYSTEDAAGVIAFNVLVLGRIRDGGKSAEKILEYCLEKIHPVTSEINKHHKSCQLTVCSSIRALCNTIGHHSVASTILLSSFSADFEDDCGSVMLFMSSWLEDILSQASLTSDILLLFDSVLYLANHKVEVVRMKMMTILEQCIERDLLNPRQMAMVASLSTLRMSDTSKRMSEAGVRMMSKMGGRVICIDQDPLRSVYYQSKVSVWWKSQLGKTVAKGNSTGFRAQHFQRMMNHLAQRQIESTSDWLYPLFLSCYSDSDDVHPSTTFIPSIDDFMSNTDLICNVWGSYECARYSCLSRLRTPFGNPAQTFEAFERMFVHASSIVDLARNSMYNTNVGWKQIPTQQLLGFIDELEKAIYRTAEPSSTSPQIAPVEKASALFFKANSKVTEDWLCRIRQSILMTTSLCNASPDAILHSTLRIRDVLSLLSTKSPLSDLEVCLVHLSTAFITLREGDMAEGLYKWSFTVPQLQSFSPWLRAVSLDASGRYEGAFEEYRAYLISSHLGGPMVVEFVTNQATECLLRLSDWDKIETWLTELRELGVKHGSTPEMGQNMTPRRDINYITALSKYEQSQWKEAHHLLSLTPTTDSLSALDHFPATSLIHSDVLILKALLSRHHTENDDEDEEKMLRVAKDIITEPLKAGAAGSLAEMTPYIVQLRCIDQLMHDTSVVNDWSTFEFDETHNEVGVWNKILRVEKAVRPQETHESLVTLLIKLSRRQGNFRLAERLVLGQTDVVSRYEYAKTIHAEGRESEAIDRLTSVMEGIKMNQVSVTMTRKMVYKEDEVERGLERKGRIENLMREWDKDRGEEKEGGDRLEEKGEASISERLIRYCTVIEPESSQVWLRYGDWCWKEGHNALDSAKPRAAKDSQATGLTEKEEVQLKELLVEVPLDRREEIFKQIEKRLLDNLRGLSNEITESEEDREREHRNATVYMKEIIPEAGHSLIESLSTWSTRVRQRLLHYYRLSLECYFNYLKLRRTNDRGRDASIVATLRLLRLLLHFGSELKESFSHKMSEESPLTAWKDILPQLFSRLGHPDPFVNSQLRMMITRISMETPHMVIYPVLSSRSNASNRQGKQMQLLLSSMASTRGEFVGEVKTLISEMLRITILWEEQWMSLLQRTQTEFHQRARSFKAEMAKLSESHVHVEKMANERWGILTKGMIISMDKLMRKTILTAAETPQEKWFQSTFGDMLQSLLSKLKQPLGDQHTIESVYTSLKEITREFNRFMKPSTHRLSEISPALSNIRLSHTPMPGVDSVDRMDPVTIESFESNVSVLATKTKPKKIMLMGSNGERYGYLLKGNEDLHLDERMMQFMKIVNQILSLDKETYRRGLVARKYTVIPLSHRSGLIQWVEGAPPLYSIYKNDQMRHLHLQNQLQHQIQQQQGNTKDGPPTIKEIRPTDQFYNKLVPALKERGVHNAISRRDWPIDTLEKVLAELMSETPKDILSKELWSNSNDALDWTRKSKVYARSLAVTSMIGYIIGLGDRHLDNILLDFSSGQLVHIDYNICFEKGAELKVPERVPFRLTPNLHHALGLTGGRNKEMLMTLLEAFVYDPLVDWTIDRATDESHLKMELSVCLNLFNSRIDESKNVLREHQNHFVNALESLKEPSKRLVETQRQRTFMTNSSQLESINEYIHQANQEEANIRARMEVIAKNRGRIEEKKKDILRGMEAVKRKSQEREEIYQVLFSMIKELEETKREEGADRSTVELAQDVVKEYRGILNCLPGDYIDHNPYHQISQMLDQMIQQPTTESHQRIKSYIGTERKSQATKEAREEVEMDIKDKLSELKRMAETVEGREGGNQRSDQRREGEKIMEWINRGRATMSSGGVTISTYISRTSFESKAAALLFEGANFQFRRSGR